MPIRTISMIIVTTVRRSLIQIKIRVLVRFWSVCKSFVDRRFRC